MASILSLAVTALSWAVPDAPREAPAIALSWEAPPGCPDADTVQDQIARLSDARFGEADPIALHVQVRVTADADGFSAALTLRSDDAVSTRSIATHDCALLGRAVAVVVAVALDPVVVASRVRTPPADPSLDAAPEPAPPDPEPAPPQPREPPNRARPIHAALPVDRPTPAAPPSALEYGVRVGLGVGGLILPGAGVGVNAAPQLGVPRFAARLELSYWAPRTEQLAGMPGAGATFQLASFGVRACPTLHAGRWRFPLCAGVDVGALVGRGEGSELLAHRTVATVWSAVALQPGFEVTLTPYIGLWGAFEGAISLNRPQFHLDNGGPLFQVAAFGPRGLLGIVVHNRRTIL